MKIDAHDVPHGIWRPVVYAALITGGLLAAALVATPVRSQTVDVSAAMQHPAVQAAVRACMPDHSRLCAFEMPGGGRIVRCLAAKSDQLTPGCRTAMEHARDALIAAGLAIPAAHATR